MIKAQKLLDDTASISENNPEIIITKALLKRAYIALGIKKYGMSISGKISKLYSKALQIARKNSRVNLGNSK